MQKVGRQDLYRILREQLRRKIDQHAVERWAATFWKLPKLEPGRRGEPFVMMFPPPNITGNLHLGHALTGAIQDAIIRQRKMLGQNCLFIPGFDHAGLATQSIVERQLYHKEGLTRKQVGRQRFIDEANQWKDQKRNEMRQQLNRLGLDLDHEREYFTMDPNSSLAVNSAFKQLFNSGVIYRSEMPIYWSEEFQTTLSDIEVEKLGGIDCYVRTGEPVQKRTLSQWFIDMKQMSTRAIDVVQSSSIEMIPANYKNSWCSWLRQEGSQDWCISRQSWWGHRIPAYKLESTSDIKENWIVGDSLDAAAESLGNRNNIIQDPDVLDTWFSSSLLPLTVSGWPDEDKFRECCNQGQFPLHIMETGFDILTYWVSKMAMISLALTDRIPFKLVLLHGMICDSGGKKMSKSLGNVIDPIDIIDGASLEQLQDRSLKAHHQGILDSKQLNPVLSNQKRLFPKGIPACGADGLRGYLLSHDFQEEVVRIRIEQIEKVRRLSNKLWNIFRYCLPMIEDEFKHQRKIAKRVKDLNIEKLDENDQEVLEHLAKCVFIAHQSFNTDYQLHRAFNSIELFCVSSLSQSYMISIKDILSPDGSSADDRSHKIQVMTVCLDTITKLLHPFMPHLTEFLHQKMSLIEYEQSSDNVELLSQQKFPSLTDWSDLYEKYRTRNPVRSDDQESPSATEKNQVT